MSRRVNYNNQVSIGSTGHSHRCGDFKIISIDNLRVEIEFLNTGNVGVFRKDHVKEGKVKDQKAPLTFGVGYTDGEITKNMKEGHLLYYRYWKQILERGYCQKLKQKHPSYKDVTVCKDWHSLKNFRVWFEENYREDWVGYNIDKDLICDQRKEKIYSPDTCVFLPPRLNTLIIKKYHNRKGKTLPVGVTKKSKGKRYCARCQVGEKQPYVIGYFDDPDTAWESYRDFKQKYIQDLTEDYFSKDLIDQRAYKALMSYKVTKEYQ